MRAKCSRDRYHLADVRGRRWLAQAISNIKKKIFVTFFNFDSWYIYEKAAESSCQLSHSTRISVSLCSKRRVRTNDVKVSFHPLIKLHSTLSLFREWWAAAKHIHLQKGGERVLNVSTSSERADIVDGNESCETHITLCGQQRWVEMKSWGRERGKFTKAETLTLSSGDGGALLLVFMSIVGM